MSQRVDDQLQAAWLQSQAGDQSNCQFSVREEILPKLKLLSKFSKGEIGEQFKKFKDDYCYRFIIKNGQIGMLAFMMSPSLEDIQAQMYKVLWVGKSYNKSYFFNSNEAQPLKKLLPYITPFFHEKYFYMNCSFENKEELMAIHDNLWHPPSIHWYSERLCYWFQINSQTLLQYFPYEQLRSYMLEKHGRKESVEKNQVKLVKDLLEKKVNEFAGNLQIKLDEKVVRQTLKEVRSKVGQGQGSCQVDDIYDVQKMGVERLEEFLVQLQPVQAPREFYEKNLENLVPLEYVRKLPSAETFEQVLRGWRGEKYEVFLTQ